MGVDRCGGEAVHRIAYGTPEVSTCRPTRRPSSLDMDITNVQRLMYQAVNDECAQLQTDVAVMARSKTEAFINVTAIACKYIHFKCAGAQKVPDRRGLNEFALLDFQTDTTLNALLPTRYGSLSSSRVALASRR